MNRIDLTGQKFNMLTVIKRVDSKIYDSRWLCQCDCGNYKEFYGGDLKKKPRAVKSCGCLLKTNLDYTNIYNYFKENGYELLSQTYTNAQEKLILKDLEGYYYTINWNNFKEGKRPHKFYKSNPYTIHNIKLWLMLNNKPFKLLSEEYKGDSLYLNWQCLKEECGEIFQLSWDSVNQGRGCSICNLSYYEKVVFDYLSNNNYNFKKQYKFDDLLGYDEVPLKYDFAIFNNKDNLLGLLEIDGNKHRIKSSRPDKQRQREYDILKNKYSEDNNIPLFRMEYNYRDKKFNNYDWYYNYIDNNLSKYLYKILLHNQ